MWLPVPPDGPGQDVSGYAVEPAAAVGTDPLHGNALAQVADSAPVGAQVIRQRYAVTAYELAWNVEPDRVTRPASWPAAFEPWLRGESSVVIDDEIRSLALSGARSPPLGLPRQHVAPSHARHRLPARPRVEDAGAGRSDGLRRSRREAAPRPRSVRRPGLRRSGSVADAPGLRSARGAGDWRGPLELG